MQPGNVHMSAPAPAPAPMMNLYRPTTSTVRPGFASRTAKVLGVTQIVLGSFCFLIQVISIFAHAGIYFVGHGIWGGIFMILAGAFGVTSATRKTTCFIITCMVLSIIAAVCAGILVALAAGSIPLDLNGGIDYWHGDKMNHRLTLDSLLLIAGLLEMITAIWAAVVCCRATCCLPGGESTYKVPYHVQYLPAGTQQPMMFMAPPGGQPGAVYAIPQVAGATQYVIQAAPTMAVAPPQAQATMQPDATAQGPGYTTLPPEYNSTVMGVPDQKGQAWS